jgi:serine/threonine protein kinase
LACSYLVDITGKKVLYPSLGAHLGVGATFSVERKEARGQKLVAVKHIRKVDNSNEASDSRYAEQTRMALEAVLVEVQVLVHLGTLDPKNIVEILAYGWDEGPLPYLVLEYADLGTLNLFLAEKIQPWEQKARISIGIASGLDLMHSCDIIHGDVKLENILVFSDPQNGFEAKLADFGFCCSENIGQRIFRGTRVYNAPEIRNQDVEDGQAVEVADYTKADVYAFGLVLWEIANNGRRYYTVPEIGVQPDDEQADLASAFLAHLDSNVLEITPYALAFLDGLDIPPQILQAMSSALQMTLARDPEARADILDVRLELDPSNELVDMPFAEQHQQN